VSSTGIARALHGARSGRAIATVTHAGKKGSSLGAESSQAPSSSRAAKIGTSFMSNISSSREESATNAGIEMTEFKRNEAQRGDALELLQSLPAGCTKLVFLDPQYRENLDRLKYGNEGSRQQERCLLPQMSPEFIDRCCREAVRVLVPSGYLMMWGDAFRVCEGSHLRFRDVLECVDLLSWDSTKFGMGYRLRRRGEYLVILQKPPKKAKATWSDHGIPDRWAEKVDRKVHTHIKPIGLIKRLISAVTKPGDLVVDPAAGSFVVMHAAFELGREFVGCDIKFQGGAAREKPTITTAAQAQPAQLGLLLSHAAQGSFRSRALL
jgi:site-specific DNA-methyltransferase (adenine-specific)